MASTDFERFFEFSFDLLCVGGFDGYFKRLNPAWTRTLGWSIDELLAKPWLDFVHPDDRQATIEAGSGLLGGSQLVSFVNRYACPDGSHRWLLWNATPHPDTETIYAVAHDITERTRTHEALARALDELELRAEERSVALTRETLERKQAEDRFRLLVDSVSDYAIFMLDLEGRVVTWNAGAQRIHGYTEAEIVGQKLHRLYPPEAIEQGLPDDELQTARSAGRAEREGWRLRRDGTWFWANAIVTPLRDVTGTHVGFAKVTRDLTERRRLQEQVQQAQKMEAVGRLAGGIAHDFNNMLSVVLGYADLIREELDPDAPLRADVEEIRTAGIRARDLTAQLLAFSRQQVSEPKVLNPNTMLSAMRKMVGKLLGADVELTLLLAEDVGNIRIGPSQFEQIVMNLAVNARDAMPRGGRLTIETKNVDLDGQYVAAHHEARPGSYVVVTASDTGVGMDAKTQARIFEPFFTTKPQGKGTGLGLATTFGIVKQCEGFIWVYSEPGAGTTFKVYFPKISEAADLRPSQRPAPASERGDETILLVEDDEQVRALTIAILRRHGYVVLEASNGGEALLICEQHGANIDLLLTDVVLPKMSGRELAERLAPLRPNMKVLYMSGYTDDAVLQHGVLNSGVPFLQKPFTPALLTSKVRTVLGQKEQRPSLAGC